VQIVSITNIIRWNNKERDHQTKKVKSSAFT